MSTLFGMMNNSTSGLQASQVGINTTSNNISNINTVGYTRQRTVYGAKTPIYFKGVGYLGTGVQTKDIQRMRDDYLEAQIRTENSKYNELGVKLEGLEQIETIFGEPSDTGLNAVFNDYFNNLEELKKDPSNLALQTLVKENGQNIADIMNQFSTKIDDLTKVAMERKDDLLSTSAELINSLKQINANIEKAYKADPTKTPNELLDQRDNLLRELSGIMDIEVSVNDNQTVTVGIKTTDGLVSIKDISSTDDLKAIEGNIESGAIKGLHTQLQTISKYKELVSELKNEVQTQLNSVITADNGEFMITDATGNIMVNPAIKDDKLTLNVDQLNAAKTSISDVYKNIISSIGQETKNAKDSLKSQESILIHLQTKSESLSGISKDEEIVNLVQFQKSYEANAKVISTITDMLDTIINRMGV